VKFDFMTEHGTKVLDWSSGRNFLFSLVILPPCEISEGFCNFRSNKPMRDEIFSYSKHITPLHTHTHTQIYIYIYIYIYINDNRRPISSLGMRPTKTFRSTTDHI